MNNIDYKINLQVCMGRVGEYSEAFFALLPVNGDRAVLAWCMKEGLISSKYECPKCGREMNLSQRENVVNDGFSWRCRLNGHDVCRSVRKGSWFDKSNMSICTILTVMRKWFGECMQKYCVADVRVSYETACDWYGFCREVCMIAILYDNERLGGVDKIVELDLRKFGKMKYEKSIEGQWVLGGIERDSNKCFFRVVENRTKESLLEIIEEWVLPGTTIISNFWSSYGCLDDENFDILKVNHSLEYVDSETDHTHTKTVEGSWSVIKRALRNTPHKGDTFDSYLFEYMWRKRHSLKMDDAIFKCFLEDVVKIYPPWTKDEGCASEEPSQDEGCASEEPPIKKEKK